MMKILISGLIYLLFSLHSSRSDAPSAPFDIRCNHVLVASFDGTISFVDRETHTTLWSVKIGGPIYSSYQAPGVVNGTYIDRGDDWNLYRYSRSNSTIERIKSADHLLKELTDLRSLYVWGELASFAVAVDAHTGTILYKFGDSSSMGAKYFEWIKGGMGKNGLVITRKDFTFVELSKVSRKVVWKVSLAEFVAYPSCPVAKCVHSLDIHRVHGHGFSVNK